MLGWFKDKAASAEPAPVDGWTPGLYDAFRRQYRKPAMPDAANLLFCLQRVEARGKVTERGMTSSSTFLGRLVTATDHPLAGVGCVLTVDEHAWAPGGEPIRAGTLHLSSRMGAPLVVAKVKAGRDVADALKGMLAEAKVFGNDILPVWAWFDQALLERAETVREALDGWMPVTRFTVQQALDLHGPTAQDDPITG